MVPRLATNISPPRSRENTPTKIYISKQQCNLLQQSQSCTPFSIFVTLGAKKKKKKENTALHHKNTCLYTCCGSLSLQVCDSPAMKGEEKHLLCLATARNSDNSYSRSLWVLHACVSFTCTNLGVQAHPSGSPHAPVGSLFKPHAHGVKQNDTLSAKWQAARVNPTTASSPSRASVFAAFSIRN